MSEEFDNQVFDKCETEILERFRRESMAFWQTRYSPATVQFVNQCSLSQLFCYVGHQVNAWRKEQEGLLKKRKGAGGV